jgi:hypothetical protein
VVKSSDRLFLFVTWKLSYVCSSYHHLHFWIIFLNTNHTISVQVKKIFYFSFEKKFFRLSFTWKVIVLSLFWLDSCSDQMTNFFFFFFFFAPFFLWLRAGWYTLHCLRNREYFLLFFPLTYTLDTYISSLLSRIL